MSSKFSVVLSFLCAIHCVLMPFLILSFPVLEATFLNRPYMEWSILAGIVFFGTFSMEHYRKKHHGKRLPLYIFISGVLICLTAMVLHGASHHSIMVVGSLIVALGQILNFVLHRDAEDTGINVAA